MTEKMAVAYFEEKIGEKAFKVCQVPTHYETLLGLSGTESFWLIPTLDAHQPDMQTTAKP